MGLAELPEKRSPITSRVSVGNLNCALFFRIGQSGSRTCSVPLSGKRLREQQQGKSIARKLVPSTLNWKPEIWQCQLFVPLRVTRFRAVPFQQLTASRLAARTVNGSSPKSILALQRIHRLRSYFPLALAQE